MLKYPKAKTSLKLNEIFYLHFEMLKVLFQRYQVRSNLVYQLEE